MHGCPVFLLILLDMIAELGIHKWFIGLADGKNFSANTASVSFPSSGQAISNSFARLSTRLTVFL
jgi:hypothetical protein